MLEKSVVKIAKPSVCLPYLLVIKQTRANAYLFNARDTLLTVAWFRVFTSSFLYLRGFVVHTKTIFTRVNIFTPKPSFLNSRGLCGRFTRLRVDGSRNRENIYAFSNLHVYVWTGPLFMFFKTHPVYILMSRFKS